MRMILQAHPVDDVDFTSDIGKDKGLKIALPKEYLARCK